MQSPGWSELEKRGHSEPQPDFPQRGVDCFAVRFVGQGALLECLADSCELILRTGNQFVVVELARADPQEVFAFRAAHAQHARRGDLTGRI